MNITETGSYFAELAKQKALIASKTPAAFFVASMLAGAYVGMALILALTCTAGLPVGVRPLVSGSVFGIGLILVMMAGAEMFTSQVMYETFGLAKRSITLEDVLRMFLLVWVGNLTGAILLAFLFAKSGGGVLFSTGTFLSDLVMKRETSGFVPLLCRGALCNWLVCLAVWTAARLKSEVAKMISVAWCLLTFVACGFENSVANMTAVSLGLFAPTPIGSVAGAAYNLGVVSLGNLIGGSLFVVGAYLWVGRGEGVYVSSNAPAVSKAPTLWGVKGVATAS